MNANQKITIKNYAHKVSKFVRQLTHFKQIKDYFLNSLDFFVEAKKVNIFSSFNWM